MWLGERVAVKSPDKLIWTHHKAGDVSRNGGLNGIASKLP
jgi:hypothetical protein